MTFTLPIVFLKTFGQIFLIFFLNGFQKATMFRPSQCLSSWRKFSVIFFVLKCVFFGLGELYDGNQRDYLCAVRTGIIHNATTYAVHERFCSLHQLHRPADAVCLSGVNKILSDFRPVFHIPDNPEKDFPEGYSVIFRFEVSDRPVSVFLHLLQHFGIK